MNEVTILWLRPDKGHVSVRRERIAEHLRSRGFEISLVDATPRNLVAAGTALLRGEYDIVLGNVRAGLYAGYPLAALTRTPFIADVSDPITDIDHLPVPVYSFFERYETFILRHAAEAVYVPQVYRTAKQNGLDGRVAPNAVDFEKFADPNPEVVTQAEEILESEGVDLSRPIALYVGVLSEGRNIETIIEAATHVPDWQIVFVGEGALSETVRSAAETTENMFWPGAFEHDLMPGFMSQATVGFCLVDIERPIKIVEYGAAGLPVLGAPGKLQQEFSADQLCFVDPKPEAIAEELHQLAAAPDLVERYAEQLRADAREHAWSSVADVYQQAINSRLDRSSATNR